MSPYKFVSNPRPTLGVEIELNLVDSHTMALRSGAAQILSEVPPELAELDQTRAPSVLHRAEHEGLPGRRRSRGRPGRKAPGRQRDRRPPRPPSFLGGHSSVFALARPGRHTQRALPRLDPAPSGNRPPAGDVRPARPRRRRFGRQGDHDLRPDPPALAHPAGAFRQQPVLAGPEHRACTPSAARSWRRCRRPACPR